VPLPPQPACLTPGDPNLLPLSHAGGHTPFVSLLPPEPPAPPTSKRFTLHDHGPTTAYVYTLPPRGWCTSRHTAAEPALSGPTVPPLPPTSGPCVFNQPTAQPRAPPVSARSGGGVYRLYRIARGDLTIRSRLGRVPGGSPLRAGAAREECAFALAPGPGRRPPGRPSPPRWGYHCAVAGATAARRLRPGGWIQAPAGSPTPARSVALSRAACSGRRAPVLRIPAPRGTPGRILPPMLRPPSRRGSRARRAGRLAPGETARGTSVAPGSRKLACKPCECGGRLLRFEKAKAAPECRTPKSQSGTGVPHSKKAKAARECRT